MKRSLILFSIISLIIFAEKTYCMPWPPEMDICYVKFNYQSGHTYDALTLKKNSSTTIVAPEWANGGSTNEKIAYIKSQSNRKIKVKLWLDRTGVVVEAYATQSGQGIGNTNTQWFDFLSTQYSDERIMTFNSSVPSSVGKRSFTLQWYATFLGFDDNSYYWIGNTGAHYYYTLLAAPQSPMTKPWTSVLDYAGVWASGKTSETTALTAITQGAYNSFDVVYNTDITYSSGTSCNLTGLLNSTSADCRDMSAIVQIFTNALGGSNIQVRRIDGPFDTKLISPIGKGWTSYTGEIEWNYHQVGWKSNVWDACIRLDYNNPRIPVNENINGSYKNDLYFLGAWTPLTATKYTSVY